MLVYARNQMCKPTPFLKPYILVQSITGIDCVVLDIANNQASPSGTEVMELWDGNKITVATLRKQTVEWLKAMNTKYCLCPAGSKNKEALITTMLVASRLIKGNVANEVESFIRDTKSISIDNVIVKEDFLPDPVPQYKFSFNLQDRLDRFFASIDVKTYTKNKLARLHEIYVLFGVVNAWTLYMELLAQYKSPSRVAYIQRTIQDPSLLPSTRYNLRTAFMVELQNTFYEARVDDEWLQDIY